VSKCVAIVSLLAISTAAIAAPKLVADDLPGPQPEVAAGEPKVDVPPVPGFELPATEPGMHGVRELRVHGKALLGTEIKVKGYVTWVYSCAASLAAANPKASPESIRTAIENDPTLCGPAKFSLGDARTTPADTSISVVDVPRPASKNERPRAPKPGTAEGAASSAAPHLAVGELVVVTGTWTTQSKLGDRNTSGLLNFLAVDHAAPSASPAAAEPAPAAAAPESEIGVVTKVPMRPRIDDQVRNASVEHTNRCIQAINVRNYDVAMTECQAAITAWDGNHLAWYTRATVHMAKSEWPQATAAVEHAVQQRPDLGMYQLYYGLSLYESIRQAKDPKAPGVPTPDRARDALRRATKLAPDLWRAHFYLARAYRDVDDARRAAEQFALTIATHSTYEPAYIALCELYLRWDYNDEALAIAKLGTANVAAADAPDVWFELGRAYSATHATALAIDAFTKAIAGKPDDPTPKYQRGQLYFQQNDFANARRDLEAVVTSNDPQSAAMKPVAAQLLTQIAAKVH